MNVLAPTNGYMKLTSVAFGIAYDQYQTLTSSLAVFTLPGAQTYNIGQQELSVWVDGIGQVLGLDYSETSTTTITFNKTIQVGQTIRVRR
jgi:hypothetical protein